MSELNAKALEAAIAASWIPHVYISVDDGQEHEISREEIQRRDAEWTAARQACGEDIVIDEVTDHRWQIEQAITAYLAAAARPTPDAEAKEPADTEYEAMVARATDYLCEVRGACWEDDVRMVLDAAFWRVSEPWKARFRKAVSR